VKKETGRFAVFKGELVHFTITFMPAFSGKWAITRREILCRVAKMAAE